MQTQSDNISDFFSDDPETLKGKPDKAQFKKTKWFQLRSKNGGTQEYRIAGKLKGNNGWYTWMAVHWGYRVADKKNPEKSYPRTFVCIQEKNREGEITTSCPECERIAEYDNERKLFMAQYQSANRKATEKMAREKWSQDNKQKADWLFNHTRDGKFVCLAKNRDGEWGLLKLNGKTMKQVRAMIDDAPPNPLSNTEGAWLKFTPVDDMGTFKIEMDGMPDALSMKDAEACMELPALSPNTLGAAVLTAEDIQTLVDSEDSLELSTAVLNRGRQQFETVELSGVTEYQSAIGLEE